MNAGEFLLLTSLNPLKSSYPQTVHGSESGLMPTKYRRERKSRSSSRGKKKLFALTCFLGPFYGYNNKHKIKRGRAERKKKSLYKSNVQIRRMRKHYSICDLLSINSAISFTFSLRSAYIGNVNESRLQCAHLGLCPKTTWIVPRKRAEHTDEQTASRTNSECLHSAT